MASLLLDLVLDDDEDFADFGYGTLPGMAFSMLIPAPEEQYFSETTGPLSSSQYAGIGIGISTFLDNISAAATSEKFGTSGNNNRDGGSGMMRSQELADLFTDTQAYEAAVLISSHSQREIAQYGFDCYDGRFLFLDGLLGGGDSSVTAPTLVIGNQVEVKTDLMEINDSTGDQSVTGIGFQPDVVFFVGCLPDGHQDGKSLHYSAMTPTAQWATSCRSTYGVTSPTRTRVHSSANCFYHPGASSAIAPGATVDQIATFVSMDADGFTINWSAVGRTAGGATMKTQWVAVRLTNQAGRIKIGTATQGDTVINLGFKPDCFMTSSAQTNSNSPAATGDYISFGMSDGLNQRSCWNGGGPHVAGVIPNSYSYQSRNSCIAFRDSTQTTLAEGSVTFTNTGAALTWATDNAAGNQFGYIAFKVDSYNTEPEVITGPAYSSTGTGLVLLEGAINPNDWLDEGIRWTFIWGETPMTMDFSYPYHFEYAGFERTFPDPTQVQPDGLLFYNNVGNDDFGEEAEEDSIGNNHYKTYGPVDLSAQDKITVSAWIDINAETGDFISIMEHGTHWLDTRGWKFSLFYDDGFDPDDNGFWIDAADNSGNTTSYQFPFGENVSDFFGIYQHFVFVIDRTDQTMALWIDGIRQLDPIVHTTGTGISALFANDSLYFGRQTSSLAFNGTYSRLAIWGDTVTLSEDQINQMAGTVRDLDGEQFQIISALLDGAEIDGFTAGHIYYYQLFAYRNFPGTTGYFQVCETVGDIRTFRFGINPTPPPCTGPFCFPPFIPIGPLDLARIKFRTNNGDFTEFQI